MKRHAQANELFRAVLDAPRGHIFEDWEQDRLRLMIRRGGGSLCAYVGVPVSHPWAGKHYDTIEVDCHGGLTFSDDGDGKMWPAGWYWFGWDYAHLGDVTTYDSSRFGLHDTEWTVPMVKAELLDAIPQFVEATR